MNITKKNKPIFKKWLLSEYARNGQVNLTVAFETRQDKDNFINRNKELTDFLLSAGFNFTFKE